MSGVSERIRQATSDESDISMNQVKFRILFGLVFPYLNLSIIFYTFKDLIPVAPFSFLQFEKKNKINWGYLL